MVKLTAIMVTAAPGHLVADSSGAFVKVDGKETMLRSIELFLKREEIGQILLALLPDEIESVKQRHAAYLGFSGVKLVSGGPTWLDQLLAAATKLSDDSTHVLVHDAARPAVPFGDLDAVVAASDDAAAVVLATPVRGPLIETDGHGTPTAFHLPGKFMLMQTPIIFSRERFVRIAQEKTIPAAGEYRIVKGSPLNVRVGGPGDASLVNMLMGMMPKPQLRGPDNPFEEATW